MKQEFHVSSLVVLTQPSLRHQLADEIATLEGAEIHAVSDEGKLVVTRKVRASVPSWRPSTPSMRCRAYCPPP